MPITIDKALCPANHRCPMLSTCPVGAISQDGFKLPEIDHKKCIECGKCIKICGKQAVKKS